MIAEVEVETPWSVARRRRMHVGRADQGNREAKHQIVVADREAGECERADGERDHLKQHPSAGHVNHQAAWGIRHWAFGIGEDGHDRESNQSRQ